MSLCGYNPSTELYHGAPYNTALLRGHLRASIDVTVAHYSVFKLGEASHRLLRLWLGFGLGLERSDALKILLVIRNITIQDSRFEIQEV